MKLYFLKKQLRGSGASKAEADDLGVLASQLRKNAPRLNKNAKNQIAAGIGFKPHHTNTRLRFAIAGTFTLLLILTIIAQSAQPGSVLYAVKRGSEEVRDVIQPGFGEDDIKERRKSEKRKAEKQLQDSRKGSNSGKQTEAQKEAEDAAKNQLKLLEDQQKDAEDAAEEAADRAEDNNDRHDNSGSGSSDND